MVNAAGAWAGELAALAGVRLPVEPRKRFVYVIDCREASDALHKAPLTVDPSGVWFRPEGRCSCAASLPRRARSRAPTDLDAVDHAFFDSEVWPRLAMRVPAFESVKAVNAWAGHYDYNTLDQNAVIGPHPRAGQLLLRQRLFRARRAAGRRRRTRNRGADRARRLPDPRSDAPGLRRIAEGRPLRERNVI